MNEDPKPQTFRRFEEIYDTGRYLLYVACTRARDYLRVPGVEPASEFLDDLQLSAMRS